MRSWRSCGWARCLRCRRDRFLIHGFAKLLGNRKQGTGYNRSVPAKSRYASSRDAITTVGEKSSSNCPYRVRRVAVMSERALEECGLRTQPDGLGNRHAGMDAEAARRM